MVWKLVRSYGAFLILLLFFMVLVQLAGVPGISQSGVFQMSKIRTLESLGQASRLMEQSLEAWFVEQRIGVGNLGSLPLFRQAVEDRKPIVPEIGSFRMNHPKFTSVDVKSLDWGPDRYRAPGADETVEILDTGGLVRLRIVRQIVSTDSPRRLIALLVAECPIGPTAAALLDSVDRIRTHDWDCFLTGPRGEPIYTVQKNGGPTLWEIDGPYDGPTPGGPAVLAFGRKIAVGKNLDLCLTLAIDHHRAYAPAWDELIRMVYLWVLILIGGIGLAIFLARQITRPLQALALVAQRIEAGDEDTRASETDKTEIGQLATVFNGMVSQLQARHEDQIRQIAKNIQNGLLFQLTYDLSRTMRFTYVSDSVIELYGVTPEQAQAHVGLIFSRVHPDDFPRLMELQNQAMDAMAPFRAEARVKNPSGTYRWSSLASTPTLLPDGSVQWDGIEFVITELKTAQEQIRAQLEELEEKEAQFHQLADSGIALIWSSGADGQGQYFNTRWLEFRGRTFEQERGLGWLEGVHPEDREQCEKTYCQAFNRRQAFDREFRLCNAAGEYRWINELGTPNYNLKGDFLGFIAHGYDVTEKKKSLETLQRNEKLESLGVLAGGIAHDFNNLLAGVFAFVQLARESGKNEPEVVRYLDKALGAFQRAKALTHQLLTFSKGGDPVRHPSEVGPLVREAVDFALSGSPVAGEFDFEAGLWPCDIDRNQIAQVVDNLAINAVQAMPLGGRLTVRARNLPGTPEPLVQIVFTDTGIGIPAEYLSRIFDPFFTTKQKGTGLGLSTSYSIIQKHGGSIDVESTPGTGTTFRVRLPASNRQPEPVEAASSEKQQGEGTVVVMDDEAVIRELAQTWLASLGYTAVTTQDGDETLQYFSQLNPGEPLPVCTILDLTVPGGRGGRETLESLHERHPGLTVVASSGYSEDPVMARPGDFGFAGSIAKPYLKGDLVALLNRLRTPTSPGSPG